jgi:hypothetical protein
MSLAVRSPVSLAGVRATTRSATRCHPGARRLTQRQRSPVLVLAQNSSRPDDKPQQPKEEGYYDRLLKLEADPVPRDNLTSNLKLGGIFIALLGALVFAFLHSNGLV